MRSLVLTAALMSLTAPAQAQDRFLFGGTNGVVNGVTTPGTVTLTFDGVTPFTATDTGWVTQSGRHDSLNQNYLTGSFDGEGYNSYSTFVLGAAAPASPYTSATITYDSGNSEGSGPFLISLFDVAANPLALDTTRSFGDATGQTIYQDLGSGVLYGQASLPRPYATGQRVTVTLNQAFLDQVNRGLLTTFSIGATLAPTAAAGDVPEPATWGSMILGFGLAGFALRRRRTAVAA